MRYHRIVTATVGLPLYINLRNFPCRNTFAGETLVQAGRIAGKHARKLPRFHCSRALQETVVPDNSSICSIPAEAKAAAIRGAAVAGPFQEFYAALVARGMCFS